jgi:hypothetical protein
MALIFIDSFDHYQTAELSAKWTAVDSGDIAIGQGRCGTNALMLDAGSSVTRGLAFGSNTVVVGFAFRQRGADGNPGEFVILTLEEAAGGWLFSCSRRVDGSLAVYQGLREVLLGQTAPNVVHLDVWYFLELKVVFHATAGAVTVRVNNVPQLAVTGVVTLASGRVAPPRNLHWWSTSFAQTQTYFIDDFYALDALGPAPWNDFLGDCRVEYLRPRAAGALQQWSVTGAGSHWQAVDDNATPDEDGSYVEATAAGLTDTNRYAPTGLPVGPILGAQLSLYAEKTEVGPRVIAPVLGGGVGPPVGPSQSSYAYFSTVYPTNPATGVPWTIAEINAVDGGVTVVS